MKQLLEIARSIGWGAAEILQKFQDVYYSQLQVQDSSQGLVTAADQAANNYILDRLYREVGTQEFGYLSEETHKLAPDPERLRHSHVWIIDPLDGTRDFVEKTGQYAVHIALVRVGQPILAVVACPAVDKLYYAAYGAGAFVETRYASGAVEVKPLRVARRDRIEQLTLVVSRTHRNPPLNYILQHFPAQKHYEISSIGCKIVAIVEHHADVYISLSGQSAPRDWDLAAPHLILTEAGGQFSHFDGSAIVYNQPDVCQWGGLIGSNGWCHQKLCEQASLLLTRFQQMNPNPV